MTGPRQKVLTKRGRLLGPSNKALLFWPLVLYAFIQVASNLIKTNHDDYHYDHHHPSSHFHTQDARSIFHHKVKEAGSCSFFKLESCSSASKISSQPSPPMFTTSANYYLSSLLQILNNYYHHYQLQYDGRTIFGGKILMAQASSSLYDEAGEDKEIIILNSTNLNNELIQYKKPFPHIKLIEYYVSHSGFCAKFKPTYLKLAKEIYSWRNVIRPSAIDLGVADNSPIARSWSIEIVPTLRIQPPPNPSLAEKLNKQLSEYSSNSAPSELLQKLMFEEYINSKLMIQSLGVLKYMDKAELLKSDLLDYIRRYVREQPNEDLPISWPNLRPVTESSLAELRRNHPRHELFLLIEGPTSASADQSSTVQQNIALNTMLELSSSAVWKAIRYVRSSENRPLIEDVIAHHKTSNSTSEEQQQDKTTIERLELLNNLLSNEKSVGNNNNNDILLIHIDDSSSPVRKGAASTAFPFINLVTNMDLLTMEQSVLIEQNGNNQKNRAKRNINHFRGRNPRSLFESEASSADNNMSIERKIELMALYIKQTYTETKEDRDFVDAISSSNIKDEKRLGEQEENLNKAENRSIKSQQESDLNNKQDATLTPSQPPAVSSASPTLSSSSPSSPSSPSSTTTTQTASTTTTTTTTTSADQNRTNTIESEQSKLFTKISNIFNFPEKSQNIQQPDYPGDYGDKLKAIRYLLFNEIPRTSIIDKSFSEQQEKLNTLVNLVTVIKSYFPLPNSSSVQFIDGVHNYLLKLQLRLLHQQNNQNNNNQERGSGVNFDTRAFKQELKRLEGEDKRLPEIKDYKHCKNSGYPCAIWRLFHTLAAFEYKKLSQMRQPPAPQSPLQPHGRSSALQQQQQQESLLPSPYLEAITIKPTNPNSLLSPVERLVSPPSTTTSLALTIATPSQFSDSVNNHNHNRKPLTEADLPTPVILVMRDYITNFFSCEECKKNFRTESADLSLEKIRHQEPAEFSMLWLWETHNRVNKRLSVDPETNPKDHPKVWFPTYEQCATCYKKPPSFLQDSTIDPVTIFHESIEWNKQEVLSYLISEYTKQPMDNHTNIFGYQVPYGFGFIIVTCICCLVLVLVFRCLSCYIERQKRHKATLLNGNGTHYTLELQLT